MVATIYYFIWYFNAFPKWFGNLISDEFLQDKEHPKEYLQNLSDYTKNAEKCDYDK